MSDTGIVDTFLDTFTTYIDSGFGLLGGEIGFLSTTLIAIDVTIAGLFWAWGADEDVIQRLVKKTLYIGAFAFIIGNFHTLATVLFESFAGLGLKASGDSLSLAEFMKPGTIAAKGLDAAQPLIDAAKAFSSLWAVFANLAIIVVLLLAYLIVVLAFFVIAIQVFITLIEFKLVTLAGFVLLPFAFWNRTAFMAEKVLGHIVSSGIKVLVLAVITGIGTTLFSTFTSTIGPDPDAREVLAIALGALSLLGSLFSGRQSPMASSLAVPRSAPAPLPEPCSPLAVHWPVGPRPPASVQARPPVRSAARRVARPLPRAPPRAPMRSARPARPAQ